MSTAVACSYRYVGYSHTCLYCIMYSLYTRYKVLVRLLCTRCMPIMLWHYICEANKATIDYVLCCCNDCCYIDDILYIPQRNGRLRTMFEWYSNQGSRVSWSCLPNPKGSAQAPLGYIQCECAQFVNCMHSFVPGTVFSSPVYMRFISYSSM